MKELLDDLQNEFLNAYKDRVKPYSRSEVINAKFPGYFLGTIIVSETDKAIIDGQQRLTSLTLLLIYLHRHEIKKHKIDVERLIASFSAGELTLNINVEDRKEIMNDLMTMNDFDLKNKYEFEEGEDADDSDSESYFNEDILNIYYRYNNIEENLAKAIKDDLLEFFADWLLEKVYFLVIEVDSDIEAHKIFVTMNDRGLRLSPLDMLKGFLLSGIDSDNRAEYTKLWNNNIIEKLVNSVGKDEDSTFIKTWLRARYAITIRKGQGSDENTDFEKISDTYHRWIYEKKESLKLKKSDDFRNYISSCEKYSDIYCTLMDKSINYDSNPVYKYIYYNSHRNLTLQFIPLLASIDEKDITDNQKLLNKKIQMVSSFIDYFVTLRSFSRLKNNYDTLRVTLFEISKNIRGKDIKKQSEYLKDFINKYKTTDGKKIGFEDFNSISYTTHESNAILYILARISEYIYDSCEIDESLDFKNFIKRKRGKTYDIEHIIPNKFEEHGYKKTLSIDEFEKYRNLLGGLILLPRDINRSLQDMKYEDKVEKYSGYNVLAKSLNPKFYKNNPKFKKFLTETKLKFQSYDNFSKDQIIERHALYKEISNNIWNIKNFDIK